MKKNFILTIFILLALLLVACSPDEEKLDITLPDEMLDTIWEWTEIKVTDPEPWSSTIVDPPNYTVFFNSDGYSDVEADCNFIQGQYELNGDNLDFSVGAPTYYVCAPESASCTYLVLMGQVDSYRLEDGKLILPFGDGAGELIFSAASGDGLSDGGRGPGEPSGPKEPGGSGEPVEPGSKKAVVCHKPQGKNPITLEISVNALKAHLAHGDTEGPCP